MARPKGFKLSPEQKIRMQAGRKKAKEKASEGMIPGQEKTKKEKIKDIEIIGYGLDNGINEMPYPIFASEKETFRGQIYASPSLARSSKK